MTNRIIEEHVAIWREFHEPFGITLSESKADWLELLAQDPGMRDEISWGVDLVREHFTLKDISDFEGWLKESEGTE